jgi:hypothetical protein
MPNRRCSIIRRRSLFVSGGAGFPIHDHVQSCRNGIHRRVYKKPLATRRYRISKSVILRYDPRVDELKQRLRCSDLEIRATGLNRYDHQLIFEMSTRL